MRHKIIFDYIKLKSFSKRGLDLCFKISLENALIQIFVYFERPIYRLSTHSFHKLL